MARKIEIEAEGISEERRIELRTTTERAEAVGRRAERRMERRIQEIEEQLRSADRRITQSQHRMAREKEEIDGAEVRAGRDGLVKVGQYRDWRSGGKLQEYKAGVAKHPLDIIADVINPKVMTVKLVINEVDFHFLSEGLPVQVTLPAFPGKFYPGKLTRLGAIGQERNRVDPTARSGGQSEIVMFSASITFDGQGSEFRPGMSALVEVIVEEEVPRLVVPRQAVSMAGETPTVIIEDGLTGRQHPIKGRVFNQRYFLVEAGLDEGAVLRLSARVSEASAAELAEHTRQDRSAETP